MIINRRYFEKHLKNIKYKAGARYTPTLNVNLQISEIFDGISRTDSFYVEIRIKYGEIIREFKYINRKYNNKLLQKEYNQIKKDIKPLFNVIDKIRKYSTRNIPWDTIHKQSKVFKDKIGKFLEQLRKEKEQLKSIKIAPNKDGSYRQSPSERISSDMHHIYELQGILSYFEELSTSTKAKLSNPPVLLITGSAGTGKTHLLCDVVESRIKHEKGVLPAFLTFGEYFSSGKDIWKQVFEQLGIENKVKTKWEFLEELDKFGKKEKCRTLFIIDALNENISHAPNFWKKYLKKIIQDINKYRNIALIVSVRSGFEAEVLSRKQKMYFIHEEHNGFRFKEWEAVNKFFKTFSLPLPEIPILMPEFQNPLFLLLFCKAFKKRDRKGKKQIFRGHEGATYIFESFILNATDIIAKEFGIQKNRAKSPAYRIWNDIIKEIAREMVSRNKERIPEDKLNEIIHRTYPQVNVGKFNQALENNMLILKVPRYTNDKIKRNFDIRFPFQKFSDHLVARYIFRRYEEEFSKSNKNLKTAKRYFSKRRKLGKYLTQSWNRGIIEALSIQCPEQLKGVEFIEIAPYLIRNDYLARIAKEAFVDSLIWRDPKAFSEHERNTLNIINRYIIKTEHGYRELLNAFLSVAPVPKHPFNAERLFQHLKKFTMAKRDSWWSTFLHEQYGEQGAVDRLLQWAWYDQDKKNINDESIFLTSITLSWFLTTSNRFVRDKATKGLVCLLQNKIHLLPKILNKFKEVNDPYVVERLYAVSYGCVLRNQEDRVSHKILAEWIYDNIFKDRRPPVHILLRDYARGVIDIAMRRGILLRKKIDNINPPYQSNWPKKPPSEEELKKQYYPEDFFKDKTKERGFLDIWSSVMTQFGDFSSYVIGTNHMMCEWSGRKLISPEQSRKRNYEKFQERLSKKQKDLLGIATNRFGGHTTFKLHVEFGKNEKKLSKKDIQQRIIKNLITIKAFSEFERTLNEADRAYFRKEIKPFLNDRGIIQDSLENFDLKVAQRWIFKRVVELGYEPKLHGKFDQYVNYNRADRTAHKPERIGKKYQWIAYHEFMALVSDHYQFKGDSFSNKEEVYKGTWEPYLRDIDPSFIIQNDTHIKQTITFNQWKSKHGKYDAWEKKKANVDWIKTTDELPDPKNIIQISDDKNINWLMLDGFIKWEENTPPEYKRYDIPVREVWYMVKSYIVKKVNLKEFYKWAKKQNFGGRWMPETHSFYGIFLGEYPNSLAFEDSRKDYNIWTTVGRGNGDLPNPVVVTDETYLNEFTLDCTHDGSVSVKLPCKWLVCNMGLHQKNPDGRFFDKQEKLITITTDIFEDTYPSSLLIDKQAFINFLNNNGYAVCWTLLGEKQLIGGHQPQKDFAGRLTMSGAYTINREDKIIGNKHTKMRN